MQTIKILIGIIPLLAAQAAPITAKAPAPGSVYIVTRAATAESRRAVPLTLPRWRDLQPSYRRFLWIVLLFNLGNSSDAFLILRARSLGFGAKELLLLYA